MGVLVGWGLEWKNFPVDGKSCNNHPVINESAPNTMLGKVFRYPFNPQPKNHLQKGAVSIRETGYFSISTAAPIFFH